MDTANHYQTEIEDLPDELLISIFRYLPFQDILNVEVVCSKWYEISQSHTIWKNLVVEYNSEKNALARFTSVLESHSHLVSLLVFRTVNSYSEVRCLLNTCEDLTDLRMYMCGVNNKVMKDVQNYSNLKVLVIKNCYSQWGKIEPLTTEFDFTSLPKLEQLVLTDFGLNNNNVDGLMSCTNLKCLIIDKIKTVSQKNMMKLVTMKKNKLEEVSVYGLHYDDRIVQCLMECPKLTHLTIIRCEKLTKTSLVLLQEKSHLKMLSLWNNKSFSVLALEEFLMYIDFSNLFFFSLSKIRFFTHNHLYILSKKAPHLKFLGLYMCPMLNMSEDIEKIFPKSKVVCE